MSLTQHLLADAAAGTTPSPPLFLSLVLCGLWAWRGYVRAERFERETGVRPWGWSPTGWSVMCFCTTLLGRLLLESAASRAKTRQQKEVARWPSPGQVPAQPTGYGPGPTQPTDGSAAPLPYLTAPASRDILPGK